MKYIVTGAAGLIGSALIWKLNRMGIDDILAVDHLGTSEKWKNLRALSYADYMEKDVFYERLLANNRTYSSGAVPRYAPHHPHNRVRRRRKSPRSKHKGSARYAKRSTEQQIRDTGKVGLFKSYRSEYADGEQKRDFIYVKDAVKMVMFLLENRCHGIYNIGSGRAESWNALATAVFNALGKTPDIRYIDMPDTLKGKYQYFTKADMTKFNALNTGRGFAESRSSRVSPTSA